MCVREDKLWNSTFLLKRGLFIHFLPTILRKPRTLEFSTKSWTRLWTFCIGMGLFECVKAKKTSESGPFSFNMDFSYISCVQYWGKLDIWSHSSQFWTRFWTVCIGMGFFECVNAKKTSKSVPFSFNVDFLFMTFHAYKILENGIIGVLAHQFGPDCGPFALVMDFSNLLTWR